VIKYKVILEKPEKVTKEERDAAEKVHLYRHDAAKTFKLSTDAGVKIKNLRRKYTVFDYTQFTISNPKYSITFSYKGYNSIERKKALTVYKERIKNKRAELKEINEIISDTGFRKIQKIHIESNGVVKVYHQRLLESPKVPTNADRHIGVEIELGFPVKTGYDKLLPFAKSISLAGDGSIHNLPTTHHAKEVRILTTEANYKTELEGICKALNEMNAVVNDTCGLHVHLDMRNIDAQIVTKKFVNLVKSQKYLQGMVTEKRRTNSYCKPTRNLNPYAHTGRYKAINGEALYKYQTIEIRLHHGTLDVQEIINWVTLLLDIIRAEEIKRAPPTLKSFMEKIHIHEEIKEYVTKKIESNTPVAVNAEDEPIDNTGIPSIPAGGLVHPAIMQNMQSQIGEAHQVGAQAQQRVEIDQLFGRGYMDQFRGNENV
jgi:Putative amidoligase enzyme